MIKKKSNIEETWADRKTRELIDEIIEADYRLRETVPNVIVKLKVIDLYPDGPDKDKAQADCAQAKYSLLCAIGRYDGAISDYKRHLINTKDERKTTAKWVCNYSTSHEIIELAYQNFYKHS